MLAPADGGMPMRGREADLGVDGRVFPPSHPTDSFPHKYLGCHPASACKYHLHIQILDVVLKVQYVTLLH